VEVPFSMETGQTDLAALETFAGQDLAAVVVPQPNFFGVLENVNEMTDWAHANGALAIAVVNPLAMAILEPPGQWGGQGADICCGEGQPLGAPLSSGGPYFGFLCCRQQLVRQMPGRIIGRTEDLDGKEGFTLTLQAREQHIRRSKATSNICTNQGLMVTAATIHMALLGADGLANTAAACHANMTRLAEKLTALPEVARLFTGPVFHEQVLRVPEPPVGILRTLAAHNVLGGYDLAIDYPELGHAILVCATELRSERDISLYEERLARVLASRSKGACASVVKFD